jgi:hypothetical protein
MGLSYSSFRSQTTHNLSKYARTIDHNTFNVLIDHIFFPSSPNALFVHCRHCRQSVHQLKLCSCNDYYVTRCLTCGILNASCAPNEFTRHSAVHYNVFPARSEIINSSEYLNETIVDDIWFNSCRQRNLRKGMKIDFECKSCGQVVTAEVVGVLITILNIYTRYWFQPNVIERFVFIQCNECESMFLNIIVE